METYSILRQIADSWVLLAMFCFFISVILWAFRPGSTAIYKSVSEIPLRNESLSLDTKAESDDANSAGKGVNNDTA